MGFDWEEILGCDDGDMLQECYDEYVFDDYEDSNYDCGNVYECDDDYEYLFECDDDSYYVSGDNRAYVYDCEGHFESEDLIPATLEDIEKMVSNFHGDTLTMPGYYPFIVID